jgi:hypothetical protein
MRHQFISAQLLWQAQAALDAEASQPRPQASITDHLLRHGLVRGALTLLALVASATVVSGLH